jgi:hypothetical protein
MSYTPESEDIQEEKERLIVAIKALLPKLQNRALENLGIWNKMHRNDCLVLRTDLEKLLLRLDEF